MIIGLAIFAFIAVLLVIAYVRVRARRRDYERNG
jgi:heme/copper-type cytochrome/quinol oxidase subunit 2